MTLKSGRFAGAALAMALAVATVSLSGCGDESVAGTTEVSGLVTLDGKPVDKAAVAFIGNNGARLATAQTDSAGKFTIRAALGKNAVTVAKGPANAAPPPTSDEAMLMPTDQEYQAMQVESKGDVPAKYADPNTSGLSFDVTEGMPVLELALSSQ